MFAHLERGIVILVHGDDYVPAGLTNDLDCLEEKLGKKYEIKTQKGQDRTEMMSAKSKRLTEL